MASCKAAQSPHLATGHSLGCVEVCWACNGVGAYVDKETSSALQGVGKETSSALEGVDKETSSALESV